MKRIIFVEDDPGSQDALKMVFDPAEYELIVYANGKVILEGQAPVPDLYLLDKQLSGVDGLDICRFLKNNKSTCHIPVIMVSASPHIKRLAVAAGANDTLEKPFSVKELRAMVQQYIKR